MTNILYVCESNLGRSPTAQTLTEGIIRGRGLEGVVSVDSAGILNDEINRRRERFTQNYGLAPEEYVKQNGSLPHYSENGDGSLKIDVDLWSAGDKVSRIGAPPAYLHALKKLGLDYRSHSRKVSKPLTAEEIKNAQLVLTMTEKIRKEVQERFPESADKTHVVTRYAGIDGEIDDPFFPIDRKAMIYRTLDGTPYDVSEFDKQIAAIVPSVKDLQRLSLMVVDKYTGQRR